MTVLFRWVSARHLLQEGGRSLLPLLGVALGVAVFLSVRLANRSAMASFADTVDSVAGRANLQVAGDSTGFDERVFPKVRSLPGVRAAAPVVQIYALAKLGDEPDRAVFPKGEEGPYGETLLVLGLDIFSERPFARFESADARDQTAALEFLADPRGAAVTRALADRYRLGTGDSLVVLSSGQPVRLTVRLILDAPELQQAMGGNVVLMDIGVAQEAFHRTGKLDRIDLIVDPERRDEVRRSLAAILPSPARAEQPQGRTGQVENMVSAFELNLTALAFIALFVSMFLIFNAVSMSVLRRRREIGILRSLGVTRQQILSMMLAEAAVIGMAGSLLGLGIGTLLAQQTLGAVARTLTALYLVVHARTLHLDPGTYAAAFALGTAMSLLSALAPAIEASRTPPNVTMRQGILVEAQTLPIRRWTAVGIVLVLLAGAVAAWTVGVRRPIGGFVSAFLLLAGFALAAPAFTLLCEALAAPVMSRLGGLEGVLGTRNLRDAVARTSVVVAALMVSVGMMVALSIMVGSFRQTVRVWVDQTILGDLYIEPIGRRVAGSATALPDWVVNTARRLPGVAVVDTFRSAQITYRDRITYAVGVDFDVQRTRGRLLFMSGSTPEVLARAQADEGVVVTESFAFRFRVKPGDTLELETPYGPARLPVSGVFYDYSTDAGYLMMDHRLFSRLWKGRRVERLALYLQPGVDPDAVRSRFTAAIGDRILLYVTPNRGLRERVLTVFDQTFQITYALQAIAVLVSVLGVITTLTQLILQRGREIGVLRAVGALRRQVRKIVLVESGLLGLIGALLGCVCGIALSFLLTFVINKQFFGWSIRMTIDPWLFVQTTGLMVVTAVLAGLVPAQLAATRVAAQAMRVE